MSLTRPAIALALAMFTVSARAETMPAPGPDDQPNVSFVRENAEPLLFAVTIKVDGRKVVTLSQGEYTSVHLAPGDHVLGLDWPFFSGHSDTSATFKIEAGKTYDFFVVGSLQQAEKYNQMDAGSGFDPVAPEEAQARIQKCCKFTPPR